MTRNLISFAAASAALLTLSACGSDASDAAAEANNVSAHAAQVHQLPPSILASRTYRCADNRLVYVDFFTNNTAQVRTEQNGPATTLTAEGGNPPFVAEGYSIAANDDHTQITLPGGSSQSCRSSRS